MATKSNIKSKLQAQGATVIDGKSANIVADNIEAFKALLCSPELRNRVAELFPSAFADGELQIDALLQSMGQYADNVEDHESYPISWRGKAEAEKHAQRMTTATLRPCIEESVGKDGQDGVFDSQNLYIEGDNLEVLKVLERSYAGQIKMIYIDPPYNTGNDFIYKDKYADGIQTYLEYTGQKDDKGNDKSTKKETSGASHSNWLSMMYPRLEYAKRLLSDDGVIFISIDDNEQANLKRLCDLVFGETNFVAFFPWRKRTAKSDVPHGVSQDFEYIILYAFGEAKFAIEKETRKYYETSDYPNEPWRTHDLTKQCTAAERPNSFFTIINPKNGCKYPANPNRVWCVTIDTIGEYLRNNRIIFPGDYEFLKIKQPVLRYWKSDDLKKAGEDFGAVSISTQLPDNVGLTGDGTKDMKALFENIIFSFPKPVSLLKYIINLYRQNDYYILDFFSGSSTTAHSVMQLNAENNENRRFIMVQLPEPCTEKSEAYKAGFKNIAEIGKERIRRAGKAIKKEHPEANIDIGFKVFKLDSSNLKKWDDKPAKDAKEVENRLLGAQDMMVPGRSHLDVVYEYMLKYGLTLDWQVECVKVHNKDVYVVAGGMFMVCLDHDLDKNWADELVKLKKKLDPADWRVLVADESFGNETKTRDNNAQNIFHTLCDADLAPVNFIIA